MLFNSFDFALFLPLTFLIFWWLNNNQGLQNKFILLSSYIFYGFWDWKFLILIFASTLVDFYCGLKIGNTDHGLKRKSYFFLSIVFNLGMLFYFKYYNFFIENFIKTFSIFGFSFHSDPIKIILPVGISFYTFQTMSYTIDVYRNNLKPTRDFVSFAAFVSFFPQLVAGPIERASNLLPQFSNIKKFNYNLATDGLKIMLWGFFKKIVIADNLRHFVNDTYSGLHTDSISIAIAIIFFTIQVYCDFSGYSDIAIGVAKLFGFNLLANFKYPLFSKNIVEFWQRWHISLSSWFKDYLYYPLGGNKSNQYRTNLNVLIVFTVSGLWHGSNWTYITWGCLNGCFYIITKFLLRKLFIAKSGKRGSLYTASTITFNFLLVSFLFVIFRSTNLYQAADILSSLFHYNSLDFHVIWNKKLLIICALCSFLFFIEYTGRQSSIAIEGILKKLSRNQKLVFCYFIILLILFCGDFNENEFIYFQF
jgi:D-alanyl-lipoteichoic acid acyltransferase DltB (MBOAT superfamily)